MKKGIILALSDEELMELRRIFLDDDRDEAMRFVKKHLEREVNAAITGEGHCKPWFEVLGRCDVPEQFRNGV